MKIRDSALAYVAQGWPVLATWRAEKGRCFCPKGASCKSPGKHPRPDINEHGVTEATADPSTVAQWPDDINIGIALGTAAGGAMAFDVDDSDIAQLLLDPNLGLEDQTGVVFTGRRGCHVWFQSTGSTRTFHLRAVDGRRIGEVRGDGAYVVAPPSVSVTGRSYRWMGRRPGDPIPRLERVNDPLLWVQGLLLAVGVDIVPPDLAAREKRPEDPIYITGIPNEMARDERLTRYRMAMNGSVKDNDPDRSGTLYGLTKDLIKVARDVGYPLSAEQLAGILKKYDTEGMGVPKYSQDRYYWDLVVKELPEGRVNGPATPPSRRAQEPVTGIEGDDPSTDTDEAITPTGGAYQPRPDYVWDENDGRLYYQARRSTVTIANFKPTVIEDVEIYYGDGAEKDTERAWRIQFTLKGGRSTEFQLHSRDNTTRSLEAVISRQCPADFRVSAGQYGHLKAALQELSEKTYRPRRAFATTGWVQHGERWVYLLPGCPGGLTAEGFDPTIRLDMEYLPEAVQGTFATFKAFGLGVRSSLTDEERAASWEAFCSLVEAGPVEKTLPIILTILAGPLCGAGVNTVPPLVHVMGRTGSLKTSYSLAAMSLFGTFVESSSIPYSWSSTINSLQALIHRAKDVTILADDYKRSFVSPAQVTRFIQNYADRTGRGRATGEGEAQVTKIPRGVLLSNGEDTWESQASELARTLRVDLIRGDITIERIEVAQRAVREGTLQVFGGDFLTWLAGQVRLLDGEEFDGHRERWYKHLLEMRTTDPIHLRLLRSLSTLLAVGTVVGQFLGDVHGEEARKQFREWVNVALRSMFKGVKESAEEVESLSPFSDFTGILSEALAAGKAALAPIEGISKGRGHIPTKQNADVIGYYDSKGKVLLTRNLSFWWVERQFSTRGQTVPFSWHAVVKESLSESLGRRVRNRRVAVGKETTMLTGILVDISQLLSPKATPADLLKAIDPATKMSMMSIEITDGL